MKRLCDTTVKVKMCS